MKETTVISVMDVLWFLIPGLIASILALFGVSLLVSLGLLYWLTKGVEKNLERKVKNIMMEDDRSRRGLPIKSGNEPEDAVINERDLEG